MKYTISVFLSLFIFFGCETPSPKIPKEVPNSIIDSISNEPSLEENLIAEPFYLSKLDTLSWSELTYLDPSIRIDLKYATEDNFVKERMYECGRCFLRKEVARRLVEIHQTLQKESLGLLLFDCYRPRPIQQKLWEKVPDARYVTPPEKGSMHNRGNAIDLTIIDSLGIALDMGTGFDFFGKEAHHDYTGHSPEVLANRTRLKSIMEAHGFRSIRTEWWHYSYTPKIFGFSDELWGCE